MGIHCHADLQKGRCVMSSENNPDSLFNIETILEQFTAALTSSSAKLHDAFDKADKQHLPYIYHIPKMSVSLKMELSYGNEKLKGLFRKSKASEYSSLQSTMTIDVVSIPRTADRQLE